MSGHPRAASLLELAGDLASRPRSPPAKEFAALVGGVAALLDGEGRELRPRDSGGLPGGLIRLPELPTLLLPDIHGRPSLIAKALRWTPPRGGSSEGPCVAELLAAGEANLLFLGDAFHTEARGARRRWQAAYREYETGWEKSFAMDEEMAFSLSAVWLILEIKRAFPERFHYLKGNHDNLANEEGRGDHPFFKYAAEGEMAASWFALRYGPDIMAAYRELELSLPLAAQGGRFMASHGEPAFALAPADVIEYRRRPKIVEALIWTANDEADPSSVPRSLAAFFGPEAPGTLWFGGHRPVSGRYALRAGGRFVQFHDPDRMQVVFIPPGRDPDPRRDIYDLDPSSPRRLVSIDHGGT